MVTPGEIGDADLTLEFRGAAIEPEQFVKGVRSFFGFVGSVGQTYAKRKDRVHWEVTVKEGSELVALKAKQGSPSDMVEAVRRTVRAGLVALEHGTDVPENLPENAIKKLKALAQIASTNGDGVKLNIWVQRDAQAVTHSTVAHASSLLGWQFEDYGSVEGRLKVVSHHGSLQFIVYEPLWDGPIRCYVDDDKVEEVLARFGRRVEVYGPIKYRRDGRPVSVRVREIVDFPPDEELPGYRQIRGII